MIYKQVSTQVKAAPGKDPRVLRFIGSNESVDRDGDIIDLDGWDVNAYLKNPVFLWAHDYSGLPIGKTVAISKDIVSRALMFDVRFPTVDELSPGGTPSEHALFVDTIFNLYKGGYLSATSVGFQPTSMAPRADGDQGSKPEWQRGQHILGAQLMELSGCPVPANPEALIQARSVEGMDAKTIEAVETMAKGYKPKSGARLSAKTRAAMDVIDQCHADIEMHMAKAVEAHGKASKCLKDLMDPPDEPCDVPPCVDPPGDAGDKAYVIEIVRK